MLHNLLHVRGTDRRINRKVRAAMLETLYASKASLAIGAFVITSITGIVALLAQNVWLLACAGLLLLTSIARMISFNMYDPTTKWDRATQWERIYDLGAWVHTGLLGLMTLLTLTMTNDVRLHMLVACLSTGYAAGAAGRNTGRPGVAIGQLLLCALPLSIALLLSPTVPGILLAVANGLFIIVIIDITRNTYRTVVSAYVERQEKLDLAIVYEKLSRTDPLTGVDNRVTLKANLDALLRASRQRIALLWIDLDRFKQINDTLGHAAGDIVLNAVATRLPQLAGDNGKIARFGGDEFIVVKPVRDASTALEFAEQVRETLAVPETHDGATIDFSASIGVAVSSPDDLSADDLLRHADMALYEAKSRGRNCVVAFDPAMEEKLLKTKRIEQDLRRAIAENELELHFQPIINLATGRPKGCEALLRWRHPAHGSIPPNIFIPIAEATGLIQPITEWVLDRACAEAALWPEDISVAVNISPLLLRERELPPLVHEALMRQKLPPRRLELEITESALVEDNPNIKLVLDGFQRIGIRLSLDDFGTGYSSLSYLCRFSFDTLKIDKSFTTDIHRSSEARAVIQAISGISESLKLTVVAEGIETPEQLDYVRDHGCEGGQGFFLSRPMPAEATRAFLWETTRYGLAAVTPMPRQPDRKIA